MGTADYTVTGMTCEHCAASVLREVGRVGGVTGVEVDLASGRLTVLSDQPVPTDGIRAAVGEAGYDLADAE